MGNNNTDKNKQTAGARPEKVRGYVYNGDVNVEYGGAWFDLGDWNDGYVNAVRVTDLDSACGFDGAVMIERLTVYIDNEAHNQSALDSCGWIRADVDTTTESGKLQLVDAVMSYGFYDRDGVEEVIQTQADGPMTFDGWKADKRVSTDDLRGYIESTYNV